MYIMYTFDYHWQNIVLLLKNKKIVIILLLEGSRT